MRGKAGKKRVKFSIRTKGEKFAPVKTKKCNLIKIVKIVKNLLTVLAHSGIISFALDSNCTGASDAKASRMYLNN